MELLNRFLQYQIMEKAREFDLDYAVKNNGEKSSIRQTAEYLGIWPEDDLRYRRELRRRLGRDPETDLQGDSVANNRMPSSNPSGLNRKMRRLEKFKKKA